MSDARALRLWPGVVLAGLACFLRFVLPAVAPSAMIYGFLGGVVCALAVFIWWVFFSRARWAERLFAILLVLVGMAATPAILHPSIRGGMMGLMFYFFSIVIVGIALVAWAVATRNIAGGTRYVTLAAAILAACAVFALLRTDGITGEGQSQLHWRWTPTAEEKLLAQGSEAALQPAPAAQPAAPPAAEAPAKQPSATPVPEQPAATPSSAASSSAASPEPKPPAPMHIVWPGFRGPHRDGVVSGVRINTDWASSPPAQLWRRPIGPGWSSFAVADGLVYTQEQRGETEVVACYNETTGKPVWAHRDAARFYESNGGAGPRGTPTLHEGRAYTFGATGILNALDARTGAVVWTHNVSSDTGVKVPGWGFSSSPLVVDDAVVIAASGRLASYDLATGKLRWVGPARTGSYSSPHLFTSSGVKQILLLNGTGATSVSAENGMRLWEYSWPGGVPIVQPAVLPDGGILVSNGDAGGGLGVRRLAVSHGSGGWSVSETWNSNGLKPYFNDLVVHNGHAYGFDGSILACIDLKDGARKWKGGRYGHGQLLLIADQDLLLVLSEEGELALVSATPTEFKEIARVPAIEGKTWNHPVLARDILLVRNGEEMVAFRLAAAGPAAPAESSAAARSAGANE